ncbi:MAG: hypothetical protein H0U28_13915 [Nocardioidaceae bacterium]|nr:hypothetical protein [Nocardioidaceae bacterium]
MSWIPQVGKRALKYGPQAQLAWKHAGKPAADAVQRATAVRSARRTALRHADTVVEGAILKAVHNGDTFWVVFSGGEPVAAYPKTSVPVDEVVAKTDLSKKMTPDQLRARQAARSKRRRAAEGARGVKEQWRRRRNGF